MPYTDAPSSARHRELSRLAREPRSDRYRCRRLGKNYWSSVREPFHPLHWSESMSVTSQAAMCRDCDGFQCPENDHASRAQVQQEVLNTVMVQEYLTHLDDALIISQPQDSYTPQYYTYLLMHGYTTLSPRATSHLNTTVMRASLNGLSVHLLADCCLWNALRIHLQHLSCSYASKRESSLYKTDYLLGGSNTSDHLFQLSRAVMF
jgi:hypothetical protein